MIYYNRLVFGVHNRVWLVRDYLDTMSKIRRRLWLLHLIGKY